VDEMNTRYAVVLLGLIIFGTISCNGSDYQMIGKGGPDQTISNLSKDSYLESRYMILPGLPDPEYFDTTYVRAEYRPTISDYVYNETLIGHVFTFQGQLFVGDYENHTIEFDQPGKIIIKDLDDLVCRQRYNNERRTCYVYSGYLIDNDGNLSRIEEVRIRTRTSAESELEYERTGYLVRIQRFSDTMQKEIPNPGGYNVTWSGVKRRIMPPEIPAETDVSLASSIISVLQEIYENPVAVGNITKVTYNITVSNEGETKLKNVSLNDNLPRGMEFINDAVYSDGGKPELLSLNRAKQNGDWLVSVTLFLGDFDTGTKKTVLLNASHEGVAKKDEENDYYSDYYTRNEVSVTGYAPDKRQVNDTADRPELPQ